MNRKALVLWGLSQSPLILFALVFVVFWALSDKFFDGQNLVNILIQSSSIAVAAIGMTFVLLTAGVDLSVGSVMFVAVAVSGKMIYNDQPLWSAFCVGLLIGLVGGAINAFLITRLRVIAFVATLAMLFAARGFGLWLTNTRAMNMPDEVTQLGSTPWIQVPLAAIVLVLAGLAAHWIVTNLPWWRRMTDKGRKTGISATVIRLRLFLICGCLAVLSGLATWQLSGRLWVGLPAPVLVMVMVAVVAHLVLTSTPWGRQIYAIGSDEEAARKAGVRVGAILPAVYVICGGCAALSGLIALTQTGAVSPSFGQQKEFAAIAAAVLGGTSLFGGRGSVLPGTLFGAILLQTVENGLVIVNADPYLYPLVLSGIIFVAVLLDTSRARLVENLTRRQIRVTHDGELRAE